MKHSAHAPYDEKMKNESCVCKYSRVMHGKGARHTMAGGILLHIQNLRSTPFTPFLSVREPSVFSRRTSVAWRTRALTTGIYHSLPGSFVPFVYLSQGVYVTRQGLPSVFCFLILRGWLFRVSPSTFCFLLLVGCSEPAKPVLYRREKDHPPLLGILRILGILGIL